MTTRLARVKPDSYVDSVRLMAATRTMGQRGGVEWAAAVMATPANVEILVGRGFDDEALSRARANDLVLAVIADDDEAAEAGFAAGEGAIAAAGEGSAAEAAGTAPRPGSIERAVESLPGTNVAIVSVPGEFAALEAQKALSTGLHVLLFSDNVPVEDEIALKERAAGLGLLVMGPGAGTAALGGVGLGFANAVRRGSVGVVAAAGSGAQEVMSLIDRWGGGVTDVIGVGGRDLSERVGGTMSELALRSLAADPRVGVVLFVSKPPAPEVAERLLGTLDATPTVVALIGWEGVSSPSGGASVARTLDEAAADAVALAGLDRPHPGEGRARIVAPVAEAMPPERTAVRGLFSGGTLCYESMVVMSGRLGPVHSNTPLREGWGLPAPEGAHVCLDMGEEEYTRGRPHPMIDPQARIDAIRREGADPRTAVVLLDVVLGHGAHPDPAGVLSLPCEEVARRRGGPAVVAYVLGTDSDPQDVRRQRAQLEEAGCLLAPTDARAALMAAAIATRRPEVAEEVP
ncbi:MAG: protein FdrA [Actinomycetota bacterium]